jgi:ABC-type antimicrobial peptide transport system permease subunit
MTPASAIALVPRVVEQVDPNQAVWKGHYVTQLLADSMGAYRHVVVIVGAFSAVALLLATLGIFGLVSFVTGERTREFGIRMALGSTPRGLFWLVLHAGLRVLTAGLLCGAPCALLIGRMAAGQLPGARVFDPLIYAGIGALLAVATLSAAALPAWRVIRTPPALALRHD